MKIRNKIILGSVLGSLLTVIGVGGLVGYDAIQDSTSSLKNAGESSLVAHRNAKKDQVEDYFETINSQLKTYSNNKMIIDAMVGFNNAFNEIGVEIINAEVTETPDYTKLKDYYIGPFDEKFKTLNSGIDSFSDEIFNSLDARTLKLQNLYIAENSNSLGFKDLQIAAADNSLYTQLHKQYHPFIRSFLKEFGYYDIFLINNIGDVVYSVYKEIDYATNLKTGPYANTGLARAFEASDGNSVDANAVNTIDFANYYPSYNGAAAFFSSPIFSGDRKLGVLVMQAPVDKLNDLMTYDKKWSEVGLGDSGETYIVGDDNLLRNDSRFLIEDKANYLKALEISGEPNVTQISAKETSIGLQNAKTVGTKDAFLGNEGFNIFPDYRGINVLSAYTPLDIPGLNWVLISEIDEEEAFRPIAATKNKIIRDTALVGAGAFLLFGLGAFLFMRSITNPLNRLTNTMKLVAEGDLCARAEMTSRDELEDLGNVFDDMLDERVESLQEAERQNKQLNASVIELMNAASQLADGDLTIDVPVAEDVTGSLSDALNVVVEETSEALLEIAGVTKQVDESVKLVQAQSLTVRNAAEDEKIIIKDTISQLLNVSKSIENIGGLVHTISGLARNVHESSSTTALTLDKNIEGMNQLRKTFAVTESRVNELGQSSQKIDDIVDIINTLSERTNILSVSASMQAANAGEAGIEFGVIADEMKRISESSKKSTLEISDLVSNIQNVTQEAVSTMISMIKHVNQGAHLASKSGQEMKKTQLDAKKLAQAIILVSSESQSQNKANTKMMAQANRVLSSTEKTSEELDKQSEQTLNLVAYAEKLRSELGSFKLPH